MAQETPEVVKMKQGMSYSCKEKIIILNVFKYFKKTYPEKCVTEIVRRTAKATGCSEKSVFQFRKEEASPEGFKQPSKTKIRKNLNINSRFIKYDDNVREAIRKIIYDLKYQNIVPSLSTILKKVKEDEQLPNFSVMTLSRLLADMGFAYEKDQNSYKKFLVEKSTTVKNEVKKEKTNKNPSLKSVPNRSIEQNNMNSPNVPTRTTSTEVESTKPTPPAQPPPPSNLVVQNHVYNMSNIPSGHHNMPSHMMGSHHNRILTGPMQQHTSDNHIIMDSIHQPHQMPSSSHHLPPHGPHPHHSLPSQHSMGFMPYHSSVVPHHHPNMVMQQ